MPFTNPLPSLSLSRCLGEPEAGLVFMGHVRTQLSHREILISVAMPWTGSVDVRRREQRDLERGTASGQPLILDRDVHRSRSAESRKPSRS